MNPKKLALIIGLIAAVADAGATIAGLLPPAWGLVVGALVAGLVALDRALHNVAQGVSLKSYLTSPSAWAAAIVIVASILSAIAGVVPVTYATGIAVFAGMVLRFARVLQSALQPANGMIPQASPGGLGTSTIPSAAVQRASAVMAVLPGNPTPPAGTPRRGGGSTPGLPVALLILAGSLLWGSTARAQTPSDVAPPLSFCFGASTTCVVPDSGLQAVTYDLTAKKWNGGIQAAGIGWALLYKSETPYASGVSVHATFNFSQSGPSFLAPTFAVVVAHWFEAGYTPVFYDGRIGQQITLMVGLNAETLTKLLTGKNMGQRLSAARLASAEAGK